MNSVTLPQVIEMNEQTTLRVLLVEDSPVVAERLQESLREVPGVTVTDTVDRESTAVEKLGRGGVDVIVLDLHLNRGTGFGVLRALQKQRDPKPIAIILTNYDLPEYRHRALELGADHFLDKAHDFERLSELLGDIRNQHRAKHKISAGNGSMQLS
jgi:CheY-like chemotaxis protein